MNSRKDVREISLGLVIAVVQGHTSDEAIDRAWKPEKVRGNSLIRRGIYDFFDILDGRAQSASFRTVS